MIAGPIVVINLNPRASTRRGTRAIVAHLKQLAPDRPVLERHYRRLTPERLVAMNPRAVVLGPQGVPFDAYPGADRAAMFDLIRGLRQPTLGICGGCQALALAHGGALAPVHGGTASEGAVYDGLRMEKGMRTVRMDRSDPLTADLAERCEFEVSHVEGISELPWEFDLIGTGDPCRVQAIRLRGRDIYGVQFHPELGGDGAALLRSFLRVAGILPPR